MSCGVGRRCGLDPVFLWLWCRLAVTAPIQPLAWEPPYVEGVALKKKKRQNKNKTPKSPLPPPYSLPFLSPTLILLTVTPRLQFGWASFRIFFNYSCIKITKLCHCNKQPQNTSGSLQQQFLSCLHLWVRCGSVGVKGQGAPIVLVIQKTRLQVQHLLW